MNKPKEGPSLIEDLGAIAGLYRTVFHMLGQRIQHGPHWDERLPKDTFRYDPSQQHRRTPGHGHS